MQRLLHLLFLLATPSLLLADSVKVGTSILPYAGLAERIGGDKVEVRVLAGVGADPHTYSPAPKQVVELSESDCYFACGMPFEESLLEKLRSLKNGPRVVVLSEGVTLAPFAEDDHHGHDHAEHAHEEEAEHKHEDHDDHAHHDHDHGDHDPHIWLAPLLLEVQAQNIAKTLIDLDPDNADYYRANLKGLVSDLYDLDFELADQLAPLRGSTLYVFHAAFGYFASAYGLEQKAVQIGGKEPTPKQLVNLVEQARKDKVKVIFVQPQFSQRSAKRIADEIGAAVVPIDPLAKDVLANLREIGKAVEASQH